MRILLFADLPAVYQFGVRPNEYDTPSRSSFCENQPMTLMIGVIRALLSDELIGNDIQIVFACCVGIMLITYMVAMRVCKMRA